MNLHSVSVGWSLYDGDIDQQWIEDEQILFKVINKEPEWYSWDYSAIFSFDLLIHRIHIKFEYSFMGGVKKVIRLVIGQRPEESSLSTCQGWGPCNI